MSAQTDLPLPSFPVRHMGFDFSHSQKYWFAGDPFMSHFLNNLSSLFPYGEKFFVDSVRAVRDQVSDPQLQKDISGFIGQESMHSKEHTAFNEYTTEHGVDLQRLELRIKKLLEWVARFTTPKQRLAVTCALEHFTATMAEQLLQREDLTSQMNDSRLYKLWLWHALEENEHKTVAFDVYKAVGGGYFIRIASMIAVTVVFFSILGWFQIHLMRKDGELFNWRSWGKGIKVLLGFKYGFLTRLFRPYLHYYRPSFHPDDLGNKALEQRWRARLDLNS